MDINVDLLKWFINVSIKKIFGGTVKSENMSDQKLVEELHKPIIRKFNNRKVKSPLIDDIWGADLENMQLRSKLINEFIYYYVLLTFSVNPHGLFS